MKDALSGPDVERARWAARAMENVPASITLLENIEHHAADRMYRTPDSTVSLIHAMRHAGKKSKFIEERLLDWLKDDSLEVRMNASIAWSGLYPERRERIVDNVRLALTTEHIIHADRLADHLGALDAVPPAIAALAKEHYGKAPLQLAPPLAVIALKANPNEANALALLRRHLEGGSGSQFPELAAARAADIAGDGGIVSRPLRADLLKLLEADDMSRVNDAAIAIRKLDALPAKPAP
jgi:hypothetical protein